MKKSTVAGWAVLIFSAGFLGSPEVRAASSSSDEIRAKIDALLEQSMRRHFTVGAVVGVIDGETTQTWSYGRKSFSRSEAPNGDTLYEIGSVTKTFTATALAVLAEEGKLGLQDPVSKFFPELADTAAGKIPLVELATHMSGLPRLPDNLNSENPRDPYAGYSEEKMIEYLKTWERPAAVSHQYSNLGTGLLGQALVRAEALTDFDALVARTIADSLEMKDTSVQLNRGQWMKFAGPHDSFLRPTPAWNLASVAGAGALRSSVNDLLKYARAQLKPDTSTVLGRAIARTHEVRVPRQGMGWIHGAPGGVRLIWHSGGTGGSSSWVSMEPGSGRAIVVLTNSPYLPECVVETFHRVDCSPSEEFSYSEAQLKKYDGSFRSEDGAYEFSIAVTSAGEGRVLALQMSGSELRLSSPHEHHFTHQGMFELEFIPGITGAVDAVELRQDGEVATFRRVSSGN